MESITKKIKKSISPFRRFIFKNTGRKPFSYGYNDTKWVDIKNEINNKNTLAAFKEGMVPDGFGIGYDERVVEYPWIFSHLGNTENINLLDAGSTFNFKEIIEHQKVKNKALTIFTYYPEPDNYIDNRISYVFGDLRSLPFKNDLFDEIVCQSTIEHVDMDNSIYGYSLQPNAKENQKSYEYMHVVAELSRVLKPGGQLLLTFPYGTYENHGFFQQFDEEMLNRITESLSSNGSFSKEFIIYNKSGWRFDKQENCNHSVSHNPHTGKGKGEDGAAHCRCVCCIRFTKNK